MTTGSLQAQDFSKDINTLYENVKETGLAQRRFKHQQLESLVSNLPPIFNVKVAGRSYQGRKIYLISIGSGSTSVLLWSQMHGNEATATMALFDIFNYLGSQDSREVQEILSQVTLYFIPVLNPDGANLFQRRTIQGIDMNRDALSLQCPESRILKSVRDSVQADWGFNLHDQNIYYNVGQTDKPATISFLAPAYDLAKETNSKRADAMKVIVEMNEILQTLIPGQVGKYDDTFEPRAFGDNIQKWGTRTILIESGGFPGDPEKQFIRKLNFVAILTALKSIAGGHYQAHDIAKYWDIPFNSSNLNDVIISNITLAPGDGKPYQADIAIRREEIDIDGNPPLYYKGTIEDFGDLSTQFGYQEIDGTGLEFGPGKLYPEVLEDQQAAFQLGVQKILDQGYTSIRLKEKPQPGNNKLPFDLISDSFTTSKVPKVEQQATFLLLSEGKPIYVVINGYVHKVQQPVDLNNTGWVFK